MRHSVRGIAVGELRVNVNAHPEEKGFCIIAAVRAYGSKVSYEDGDPPAAHDNASQFIELAIDVALSYMRPSKAS